MDKRVLQDIENERVRQDKIWGGPAHDDEHTPWDFIRFIGEQIHDRKAMDPAKTLTKVAALAVAALESHRRKTDVIEFKPQAQATPTESNAEVQTMCRVLDEAKATIVSGEYTGFHLTLANDRDNGLTKYEFHEMYLAPATSISLLALAQRAVMEDHFPVQPLKDRT